MRDAAAVFDLDYNDNGTSHRDVTLRFGDVEKLCDSYYFALDNDLLPHDESSAKVCTVIAQLLRQWQSDVATLEIGDTAYLPFDFSDEYSAWVRVERKDAERMALTIGWTDAVHGYSFDASNYRSAVSGLGTLAPYRDGNPYIEMSRDNLLAVISANLMRYENPA